MSGGSVEGAMMPQHSSALFVPSQDTEVAPAWRQPSFLSATARPDLPTERQAQKSRGALSVSELLEAALDHLAASVRARRRQAAGCTWQLASG
eukprot:4102228-Alexandrium_andersonii.AAC.1